MTLAPFVDVLPLKRLLASIESGVSVNAADVPAEEGQVGVLKTSCVYTGSFDSAENKTVFPEEVTRVSCPVRAGALVVSRMNTPDLVGAAGLVRLDLANIYLPDRLWQVTFDRKKADPRYIHWWTQSSLYRDQVRVACAGSSSSMQNLDQDSFRSFTVPRLGVAQQERIANFLDERTARIDALIAEKERLAERLSEFRYSTVSWAVTGGMHSERGTFETGNPFFPRLPNGWQLGGLTKYIGPVVDYRGKTPEKVEEGVLLVTARNIRDGMLDYNASAEYVREEAYLEIMRRGRPAIGDVLFTTEAPLGQVANVDREDIALAQRVVKFRGLPGLLNNYFLKYWLMGAAVQSTLVTLATGSTAEGIKASKLGQIPLALPSPDEQVDIVEFLDERRAAIDSASEHVAEHVDRLREYRSALISAAVTGQLDLGSFKESA